MSEVGEDIAAIERAIESDDEKAAVRAGLRLLTRALEDLHRIADALEIANIVRPAAPAGLSPPGGFWPPPAGS
jgi:hypothetical protein